VTMTTTTTLTADDLLIHEALGTRATYRVTEIADRLVGVEVLSAPGLAPGTRLRFTRDAAQAMACANARAGHPAAARRRGLFNARPRLAR
jgi:hypothetical protein